MSAIDLEPTSGSLFDSDFWVLGVSVRDDFSRIVEAAQDPLLAADHARAERARLTLTNPRARLDAELAWLPGLAPARARQLVEDLQDGRSSGATNGMPAIARANLLATGLTTTAHPDAEEISDSLLAILEAVDLFDPEATLVTINEDRAVGRIPLVRSSDDVREALERRLDAYVAISIRYLDKATTAEMVDGLAKLVEAATAVDLVARSDLLQNIVAAYEARALSFLEAEAATIRSLGEAIRANASKGHAHIAPATSRLGELIAGWDRVAQPIQLLRQELGDGHALSRDLARDIRSVSLELNNDHGLHQAAADITSILAAHFGEVSELRDTFERDALALEDIRTSAANSGPSEPPFSAKIGLLRTALTIDDHHLFWNDAVYPLAEIDRVRWGATRHSVNGIPTGTEYKIGFAIGARGGEIETRNKAVFQNVTSRLWRICGVRIAFEMIDGLGITAVGW